MRLASGYRIHVRVIALAAVLLALAPVTAGAKTYNGTARGRPGTHG